MFVDPEGLDRWVVDGIIHPYIIVEMREKVGDVYIITYKAITYSIVGLDILPTVKPEESWRVRFIDSTCEEDKELLDFAEKWEKIPLYGDVYTYNVLYFNCRHAVIILQGIGMEGGNNIGKGLLNCWVVGRPNVFR
jgi:hypothetical protein